MDKLRSLIQGGSSTDNLSRSRTVQPLSAPQSQLQTRENSRKQARSHLWKEESLRRRKPQSQSKRREQSLRLPSEENFDRMVTFVRGLASELGKARGPRFPSSTKSSIRKSVPFSQRDPSAPARNALHFSFDQPQLSTTSSSRRPGLSVTPDSSHNPKLQFRWCRHVPTKKFDQTQVASPQRRVKISGKLARLARHGKSEGRGSMVALLFEPPAKVGEVIPLQERLKRLQREKRDMDDAGIAKARKDMGVKQEEPLRLLPVLNMGGTVRFACFGVEFCVPSINCGERRGWF